MDKLHSASRIWVSIVLSFAVLFSYPMLAQSKVRKNSITLANSLYKEDGRLLDAAEPGETLVYKYSLRNRKRSPQSIKVIGSVPKGTTHIGGDDFDGLCGDGSAGQKCKLEVSVPGRRAGNHVVFFRVQVDKEINAKAIINRAYAEGVVCRSRRNDCYEKTPVNDTDTNDTGINDSSPGNNTIQLHKSLHSEDGLVAGVAEAGETLVYKIKLRNRTRRAKTVRVVETVPIGTTHLGGDDFSEERCGDGSAGQQCEIRTTIPGRRHRSVTLFFKVKVDKEVNAESIDNKVSAGGVDCTKRRNDCYERTRVDGEPGDTPPAVEIATPKNGDEVSGNGFVVTGAANDNNAVVSVVVNVGDKEHKASYNSDDGNWKAEIPGPLKAGAEMKIIAVAKDNAGQSTRSNTVAVKVEADTPPVVRILSPQNDGQVPENGFAVAGVAEDDNQVASIVVNDGTTNHTATYNAADGSWQANIPGPLTAGATINLVAVAADNAGQSTRSNTVSVTVMGDTAPVVQINSPVDQGQVPETGFSVSGTASDNSAVVSVTVNDGSNDIPANYNPASGAWSVTINSPLTPGQVIVLTATATDDAGNTTTTTPAISVTVTAVVSGAYESSRHLINRITFGITPTQLDEINQETFDANTFSQDQLFPALGDCTDPDAAHGASVDSASPYGKNLPNGVTSLSELQTYTILMAAFNPCQLREVLAQFWSNHFLTQWNAVRSKYRGASGVDDATAQLQATAWELQESDAFRLNALGNFRDLVEISARSPAMLYYLDGVNNVAGNPNENYPRELMELNTMGVDGGYTQTDVEQVAVALTGWTVNSAGQYTCDPTTHDYDSTITLNLGLTTPPAPLGPRDPSDTSQQNCEAAGQYVLTNLVNHPSTSDFICKKLTTLLVSEEPGSESFDNAVSACTQAFNTPISSSTQIAEMVQAIIATPEFVNFADYLDKIKTPLETAVGYVRNFEISDDGDLDDLPSETSQMSMNLFQYPAPDGFSEEGFDWVNSSLILQRFRFFADMVFNPNQSNDIYIDPHAFFNSKFLITDVQIVDYVLELALANQFTAQERAEALAVLNNGGSYNDDDAATQEIKLRKMLGLVLNYPGYQYQ